LIALASTLAAVLVLIVAALSAVLLSLPGREETPRVTDIIHASYDFVVGEFY
jgi:hypothetical protein